MLKSISSDDKEELNQLFKEYLRNKNNQKLQGSADEKEAILSEEHS